MEQLPLEIIEKILSEKLLSIRDVLTISETCSYFHNIVTTSTAIWKMKYVQKWPQLGNYFTKDYETYLEEIKYIYDLRKRVICILESMSPRFHKKYQLSDTDLEEWSQLANERNLSFYYIVEKLLEITNNIEEIKSIEVVPLNTLGNKTLQYYAEIALRYIKQHHLSKKWVDFINLPQKRQILEKGAAIVAQWCQPELDITEDRIENELCHIAELIKQKLEYINSNHQLFKTSKDEIKKWKVENLEKSQWDRVECQQLIMAMREVLYDDLGFGGNTENYYLPQNSLINKVLETKKGLPIILAVIYAGVGRRLGLLFEPINFPAHFLLRFIEGNDSNSSVYYIDTFHGGNILQKTACPYSTPLSREVLFPVASPIQVVERIVKNLELSTRQHFDLNGRVTFLRSILELLILVSPQDLSAVVNLAKLYSIHKINTKSLEDYLISQRFNAPEQVENILAMLRAFSRHQFETELEFHTKDTVARTPNVKYAVGMIMRDVANNDKCVIYGWNPCTPLTAECPVNNHNSVSYSLLSRPKQPFYNLLVEDGSYRYAPQEALEPSSEVGNLLRNKDIGRHFSHFFENHFVPNAEKEKEYPCDNKIRQKYYYEMKLKHYTPQ